MKIDRQFGGDDTRAGVQSTAESHRERTRMVEVETREKDKR